MADPTWTITPVQVADLLAAGERMPVCVHLLERDGVRVLVDTGLTQRTPPSPTWTRGSSPGPARTASTSRPSTTS
ncbi:hypothetical protein GCM10025868_13350 [Angustibacter aerolatus]|uniref:Metallo-beta-lactamase domain-containing protein n=1 Tax=Angustibacter aerolatus TaxID=1162965 RepID=A0ABQ6JD28_9ACTN|nr:hypothetical protein [Angustibacter aerolatus]GMA86085.1 hypothetical protein GCM10025868_13350 [Angustibacter aerolatus]